ncbi:tRNA dihydrouridine synthase DusB, partial [Lascolabacillus sp.]
MKIGNLEFPERPVFLAPMEDVTDIGFRLLCRQFGADMVYTEFISSDALIREIKKTKRKILFSEEERPIGIQIYGCDPDTMVEAAKICEEADPDIIDINFGCPVRKIAGKGAGSGMMRTPDIMLEITERVVKAVNKPVSVKTRLGWDDNSKIIVPLAEQLQDCGIVALTIHGRTRSQMYKGDADWSLIREVKNNPRMHIPIIGNGDVTSPEITKQRFEETGVDAIMIGRGSIGAPWIFEEI